MISNYAFIVYEKNFDYFQCTVNKKHKKT